ncbi:unnamed protein product [Rhizophagus irregularis]|nr:unnamed protein product [Rhizophagus irregularis]CAB5365252.1 unnamed protein product [Rhizophagus irregularis]
MHAKPRNCENSTQSGWAISSSSATTSGNSVERERCNPPRVLIPDIRQMNTARPFLFLLRPVATRLRGSDVILPEFHYFGNFDARKASKLREFNSVGPDKCKSFKNCENSALSSWAISSISAND